MRLRALLEEVHPTGGLPDLEITGLTADSRSVGPGSLFVAIRGGSTDGHRFLTEAAAKGAAFLAGEDSDPGLRVPYLKVPNSRLFLASAAAAWNDYPARRMVMIGVTGTDGKTTTASLLHHLLETTGHATGLVTSVGARVGGREVDTGFHVTTPDPIALQSFLGEMVAAGLTHAVVETTSHGLSQHRVAACEFDIGILTNVTHEHLDYHGSFDDYLAAKTMLFSGLSEESVKAHGVERVAVLNQDDGSYDSIRSRTGVRVVAYGLAGKGDVQAIDWTSGADGIAFDLAGPGYRVPVRVPILGAYNVANALAAAAAAVEALGVGPSAVGAAMGTFGGVPGRMERVDLGQPFLAVVDFAHTPNALHRALLSARDLSEGRVIAVFGSAGLRDREKRRMMAETSVRLADMTILTAEDPRTESLEAILDRMAEGARHAGATEGETFLRIPDRGEAIRQAAGMAQAGDIVIVCGKGHEQSMAFGDVEHPWDDRLALRAALSERLGRVGPPMPILPTSRPPGG